MNRAQNTDHAARACEQFAYSIYCQNNKIGMIIKHGGHIFGEIHKMRKGLWAFFLECAFRVLIG